MGSFECVRLLFEDLRTHSIPRVQHSVRTLPLPIADPTILCLSSVSVLGSTLA